MSAPATYAFPDVPGLVLEPMTEAHLDEAAQLLGDAFPHWRCDGHHDGWVTDVPCEGPASHARDALAEALAGAATWGLALTFQGRALEYEVIAVNPTDRVAEVALTLRATRERPAWFWREAKQPLFAALAGAGVEQLQVWIPPAGLGAGTVRQREWLEEHFGAAYTGDWRADGARRWALPIDLARFSGWPARRTRGPGWQDDGDGFRVREGTDADLDLVRAHLVRAWGDRDELRAVSLRKLEEWWRLDCAAMLLTFDVAGALQDVRLARPRRGTMSTNLSLTPYRQSAAYFLSAKAVSKWLLAVGYTHVSIFAPEAQWRHPGMQAYLQAVGFQPVQQHTQYREPFVEAVQDLAAAVAKEDPAWVQAARA